MIVNPDIEKYLTQISPIPHPVLKEMEALGREQSFPIVGPLVGRMLFQLIEFGHVHTVLECGSGYGYSAMWMALALPENGEMICIEYDDKNIAQAKEFFEKADVLYKVTFRQGNALDIVPQISDSFDLIMNDVNKPQYPELLPHMIRRLRMGGILVTDNVLWHGKVIEPDPDENTRAILQYNQMLYNHTEMWTTIIPLRDGISLSVRLKSE